MRKAREILNKSSMSRVADQIAMIARSATKVVAMTTMPISATPRARDLAATLIGTGFVGCRGVALIAKGIVDHSLPRAPCIPSRKAKYAAMRDLFSVSLASIFGGSGKWHST